MTKGNKLDQNKANDLTKDEKFEPTLAMEKWLMTAIQSDSDRITDIARESKITKQSWYNWIKDDNFLLWYRREWDKRIASEAWKLDKWGMKNAKRDHKYWQDMQRRVGNLRDDEKPNVAVQVNNITTSKKDEYGI